MPKERAETRKMKAAHATKHFGIRLQRQVSFAEENFVREVASTAKEASPSEDCS